MLIPLTVADAVLPALSVAVPLAVVENSVLFDGVSIGKGAIVRNAILDKFVIVPDGVEIGVDLDEDRRRGFSVSENGISVLGKNQLVVP